MSVTQGDQQIRCLVVPNAQTTHMGSIHFKIKINQCIGFEIKKLENRFNILQLL